MCHAIPHLDGKLGTAVDWAKWISQVLVVPLLGAIFALGWHAERRMDALELGQAHRFTAHDATALKDELLEQHVRLYEHLAELQQIVAVEQERLTTHLQSTAPADQLVRVVDYAKDQVELERRLTRLEE